MALHPTKPSLGESINPRGPQQGAPPASPEEEAANASGIKAFITRPEVQAALIQAGINLLQPIPRGQNTLGNIGVAVGAGGQAAGRVLTQQQEREQQQAENVLAGRRVTAEEERAAAATAGVEAERERTESVAQARRDQIKASKEELQERIKADLRIAQQGADNDLLETITDAEYAAYETRLETYLPREGGPPPPVPPTQEDIETIFLMQRALRDGKPFDFFTDDEVRELMANTDSRSKSLLARVPQAQIDRVLAAGGGAAPAPDGTPAQAPPLGSPFSGFIVEAVDAKQLEARLPNDPVHLTKEEFQAILAVPWKTQVVKAKYGEAAFNALQEKFRTELLPRDVTSGIFKGVSAVASDVERGAGAVGGVAGRIGDVVKGVQRRGSQKRE